MTTKSPKNLDVYILLFIFLIELFRRYSVLPQASLVLIDFFLLVLVLKYSFNRHVFYLAAIFITLVLIQTTLTHQNLMIAYLGLRPTLMFILVLGLSANFSENFDDSITVAAVYFLVTGLAITQVFVGQEHVLTKLPSWADSDNAFGHNVELDLLALFRPTAIFTHTGKLGQAAFFLFVIPASLYISRLERRLPQRKMTFFLMLCSSMLILVSQQKAALVGLTAFLFFAPKIYLVTIGSFLAVIFVVVIWFNPALFEVLDLILLSKFSEIITQIPVRVEENFIAPFFQLVGTWRFLGVGIGGFSAGSSVLGTGVGYFVAENSYMRLFFELGVGFFLYFLIISFYMLKVFWKKIGLKSYRYVFVNLCLLSLWCFTHDLYGNSLNGLLLGLWLGIFFCFQRRSVN